MRDNTRDEPSPYLDLALALPRALHGGIYVCVDIFFTGLFVLVLVLFAWVGRGTGMQTHRAGLGWLSGVLIACFLAFAFAFALQMMLDGGETLTPRPNGF